MNHIFCKCGTAVMAAACLCLTGCTDASRGRSAADDYLDCEKQPTLMKQVECKKNVLYDHQKDFESKDFDDAFWKKVQE
jgi:hypothetical protein